MATAARRKVIVGNWKMNQTINDALTFTHALLSEIVDPKEIDVVICPPYTAIHAMSQALLGTSIALGAQDASHMSSGAYTSQISMPMVYEAGARYVLIAHRETRVMEPYLESHTCDAGKSESAEAFGHCIAQKVEAALAVSLNPLICVGETALDRREGRTNDVVRDQVRRSLKNIALDRIGSKINIVYEVSNDGGSRAPITTVFETCGQIRAAIAGLANEEVAQSVRVLYGGSIDPDNVLEYLTSPMIDGVCIGKASLNVDNFAQIIHKVCCFSNAAARSDDQASLSGRDI